MRGVLALQAVIQSTILLSSVHSTIFLYFAQGNFRFTMNTSLQRSQARMESDGAFALSEVQ